MKKFLTMGIIDEYFRYQEKYEEKYGKRTIVLYQNGSFFEVFEYDPGKDQTNNKPEWPTRKLGYASHLSGLIGYTLTRRSSKKPYSFSNPNMVGFPCISYEKHKNLLLSKNYTLVLVEQDKPGKNAVRSVTQIVSPGTEIDNVDILSVSNNIVSVHIDIQKHGVKIDDDIVTVGMSCVDLSTGKNIVAESYSNKRDALYGLHEAYRFLLYAKPKEVLIHVDGVRDEAKEKYKEYLHGKLELSKYPIYMIKINQTEKEYMKSNYHQQFLSKIFCNSEDKVKENNIIRIVDNCNIISELNLERFHYGTISYIILLQYCYEHNKKLIEKLEKPNTKWIDEDKHLVLTHNASKQLDIFSETRTGKRDINCLMSVIDNTNTIIGRRYLNDIICNPITSVDELEILYDMTEYLINEGTVRKNIMNYLKNIPDIERYQRKLQLTTIKPNEFSVLIASYINVVYLYNIINKENENPLTNILFKQTLEFNNCLSDVMKRYNLESLRNVKMENEKIETEQRLFHKGIDEVADKYLEDIENNTKCINEIVNHLNGFLESSRGKLIEYGSSKKGTKKDESRNLALFTTIHKGKILKNSEIDRDLCGDVEIVTVNKEAMITSSKITKVCRQLVVSKSEYAKYLYRRYVSTIYDISEKYTFFNEVATFIGKLDYVISGAITAIKNNYFRPKILKSTTDVSCFNMKELRHPIAEKIINSLYIANDLDLGSRPYGMLLYGANSVGKSTLTKAVGLNIIMAQAGMFVPSKMEYVPYNKIITRLSGDDRLIEGKSSFVIEMEELRTILRNADSKSLVLGDELCRGTESASGTGLTIATIEELSKRKSSFIFSTHMHHLVNDDEIGKLKINNDIRICHMVLRYDGENNMLIYDRKLRDGSGESIYGLEVAKSLSLNDDFIKRAYKIRNRVINEDTEILKPDKSRYNSKVYVDSCSICKKKSGKDKLPTHHINHQCTADKNGFINYFHKNSKFNLLVLCDECHKKVHVNNTKIETQETSKGNMVKITL